MKKGILIVAILLLVLVGAFFTYQTYYDKSKESIPEDLEGSLNEILGMPVPGLGYGEVDEMIEQPTSNIKEFDIIAKQWEFDPSTIEVDFGDTVILNIESIDVDHGIMIPDFGVNKMLNTGEKVRVEFVASKKGSFSFFCNVFCGEGHSSMDGNIIVN